MDNGRSYNPGSRKVFQVAIYKSFDYLDNVTHFLPFLFNFLTSLSRLTAAVDCSPLIFSCPVSGASSLHSPPNLKSVSGKTANQCLMWVDWQRGCERLREAPREGFMVVRGGACDLSLWAIWHWLTTWTQPRSSVPRDKIMRETMSVSSPVSRFSPVQIFQWPSH